MSDYWSAGYSSSPDFVMLGVTLNDGRVMLVASDTLTSAEISQRMDEIDVASFGDIRRQTIPGPRWCEVQASMHDLIFIYADDYAAAFRKLFEDWEPKAKPRKGLGRGEKAIGQGQKELRR